jgi:hypothetical protein
MQQQCRQYPRHQIESLSHLLSDLKVQAQALWEEQQSLTVQHAVAVSCCEVLHSIRDGGVHEGWGFGKDGLLRDELPLLLDLGFQVDLSQQLAAGALQQVTPQQNQQQDQQQHESRRMTRARAAAAAPAQARLQEHMSGSSRSSVFCWDSTTGPSTATARPAQALAESAQPFAGQQRPVLLPGELMGTMKYALSQPPFPGVVIL